MKSAFLFVMLFGCMFSSFGQKTIESIGFEGLSRTKVSFLSDLLNVNVGDEYNHQAVGEDLQWLLRMDRFFEVDTLLAETDSTVNITFVFREAEYRYPMIGVDLFSDIFKLYVGGKDLNFRGKMIELGGHYLYYDRHSFAAYLKRPYITRNLGASVRMQKYSTNEPLYFLDTVSLFEFDNYALSLGLHRWLNDRHMVRGEVSGLREYYRQTDEVDIGLANRSFDFWKYQVKLGYRFSNLRYYFEKIDGVVFEVQGETVQTKDFPQASFFRGDSELKYFQSHGRWNVASRIKAGISTNNFSPFTPYVVDGFVSVRGIGNRIQRGTAQWIGSAELRFRAYQSDWMIMQLVGFTDAQQIRLAGASNWFHPKTYSAAGLGLRILPQKWYKAVLRLDYSIWTSENRRAFSFGLGHFF